MPVITEIPGDGDEGFSRAEAGEFDAMLRSGSLGNKLLRLSGQYADKLLRPIPTFYAPLSEIVMIDSAQN